jgi:hypothetical protein
MKSFAYLLLTLGALGCALAALSPVKIAGFGYSVTLGMKVDSLVPVVSFLLLIGGLALWFWAARPKRLKP